MRPRMHVFSWGLAVVAVGTAILGAQSRLTDFGLNVSELKTQIVDSLAHGFVPAYPSRKAYHAASAATQVAFVRDAFAWLKAYTETPAFKADYEKRRAAAKPEPPPSKGTPDEQFAQYQADQRKQLEDTRKNINQMSPDMQKQMQPVLQQMADSIDQVAKNPQMVAMLKQGYAQQAETDRKQYEKELAEYNNRYPADPRALIATRLREFLDESKDVDYDAKLVESGGGRMRFADEQYESKPDRWKMYYRAGKEPTEAARAFAADWLRQLEAK